MQWKLFSFNVSAAFLKGVTSEEYHAAQQALTGERKPDRAVHLDLPRESIHPVKKLKGLESLIPGKHCLKMVKGGFGLKDSPRMRRVRLHSVLISPEIGLNACQADQSIYCKHKQDAQVEWVLVLVLSTHVHDLKGGGLQEEVDILVKILTDEFGK